VGEIFFLIAERKWG